MVIVWEKVQPLPRPRVPPVTRRRCRSMPWLIRSGWWLLVLLRVRVCAYTCACASACIIRRWSCIIRRWCPPLAGAAATRAPPRSPTRPSSHPLGPTTFIPRPPTPPHLPPLPPSPSPSCSRPRRRLSRAGTSGCACARPCACACSTKLAAAAPAVLLHTSLDSHRGRRHCIVRRVWLQLPQYNNCSNRCICYKKKSAAAATMPAVCARPAPAGVSAECRVATRLARRRDDGLRAHRLTRRPCRSTPLVAFAACPVIQPAPPPR